MLRHFFNHTACLLIGCHSPSNISCSLSGHTPGRGPEQRNPSNTYTLGLSRVGSTDLTESSFIATDNNQASSALLAPG